MSKYYKAEDIDKAIREAHAEAESNEIGKAMFHLHCVVSDLPTIENEDCISREYMLKLQRELHGWMSNAKNHELWQKIKDAPSVVPKVQSED